MEKLWNWNPLQYGFNLVKNRRNSSTEATSQMYDINSNGVKDCNEHRCNISELYSSNKSPFRKKQTSLCLPLNNNEHKDQNLDQGAGQSDDGTTKLTEFQRKAVRDAWHSASIKRGHAGLWIFQRLFTLYPELKVIFRVDDNIPIDQLFKDETLIGHARVFQNVIEMVVDSTDALDDVMGPLLFSYGSRHAHFPSSSGFKPDYWDLFAAAMTDYARHSWRTRDKKTIEAWRLTVGFIISKMKEGFYFECKKMEKESAQHH